MPKLVWAKGSKMKTDAMLAQELLQVIELRKQLDKRESDLKELFKVKMGNIGTDTLAIGGVVVSLIEKSRLNLDKKALVAAFGEEIVSQLEKVTEYTQVDVKAQDAAVGKRAA
jgi:hypothetical protein